MKTHLLYKEGYGERLPPSSFHRCRVLHRRKGRRLPTSRAEVYLISRGEGGGFPEKEGGLGGKGGLISGRGETPAPARGAYLAQSGIRYRGARIERVLPVRATSAFRKNKKSDCAKKTTEYWHRSTSISPSSFLHASEAIKRMI